MRGMHLVLLTALGAASARGAEWPVNGVAAGLRFEHACTPNATIETWRGAVLASVTNGAPRPEPLPVFHYVVAYADGSELPVVVRWSEGVDATQRPVFDPVSRFGGPLAWADRTEQGHYVMRWPNPYPEKIIASVRVDGDAQVFSVTPVNAPATGRRYYVAPAGDDANPGTFDRPWASPHKAAAVADAGDTVFFREGIYAVDRPVMPAHSGQDGAWITFCSYPGESAVFNGRALTSARAKNELVVEWNGQPAAAISTRTGVWHILGRSYVRLLGLAVQDSGFAGIGVDALPWWPVDGVTQPGIPASHHIEILHCRVQRTSSVGIGVYGSILPAYRAVEHVKVVGNLILRADDKATILADTDSARARFREDMRLRGKAKGGDENLDFHAVQHLDVAYNEVGHGGKEGIDLMNGTRHATVHHNYVHDQFHGNFSGSPCGIYLDCRSEQWDIEVAYNVCERNGQGIQANAEDDAPFHDIRIHSNICRDNYWNGINVSLWRDTSKSVRDIVITNNAVIRNGFLDSNKPPGGGIHIGSRTASMRDVLVRDNTVANNRDYQIAYYQADLKAANIVIDRNRIWPAELKTFDNPDWAKRWVPTHGENATFAEPRFADLGAYDLLSPAHSLHGERQLPGKQ